MLYDLINKYVLYDLINIFNTTFLIFFVKITNAIRLCSLSCSCVCDQFELIKYDMKSRNVNILLINRDTHVQELDLLEWIERTK